jgi:hypothetical protein
MAPRSATTPQHIDVTAAMDDKASPRPISLNVLPSGRDAPAASASWQSASADPFANVEV